MKKRTLGILATLSAVSTALIAFTGAHAAGGAAAAPPGNYLTAEQTRAEFGEIPERTELVLPNGVSWPTSPPAVLSEPDSLFEEGFVDSVAQLYWLCAWEDALLKAADKKDAKGLADGRNAMALFAKSDWFHAKGGYDPDGTWRKDVLKPALAGDLSGVKTQLSTCDYFYDNQ